jgi:hypothetical protein
MSLSLLMTVLKFLEKTRFHVICDTSRFVTHAVIYVLYTRPAIMTVFRGLLALFQISFVDPLSASTPPYSRSICHFCY